MMISQVFLTSDYFRFGDSEGFAPNTITPKYCIAIKYEKHGIKSSIHAFQFIGLGEQ
jgi:hypothetical protein